MRALTLFLFTTLILSCSKEPLGVEEETTKVDQIQKFEPDSNEVILVIGQSDTTMMSDYVAAAGRTPGGFMFYINLVNPTSELNKIKTYLQQYTNVVVQIGIWTGADFAPGQELSYIENGNRDIQIRELADWCKDLNRPVFLRFGYEFDGNHNAYPPEVYKSAYKRFADIMRDEGVDNVAYVWHSYAAPGYNGHEIEDWYPGDDYVDWMGVSVFGQGYNNLDYNLYEYNMRQFAIEKDKPVMLAESASIEVDSITENTWNTWFTNTLNWCNDNDEIKMLCYINTDWDGSWGDTRIERNPTVLGWWLDATEDYLQSGDSLYSQIGF